MHKMANNIVRIAAWIGRMITQGIQLLVRALLVLTVLDFATTEKNDFLAIQLKIGWCRVAGRQVRRFVLKVEYFLAIATNDVRVMQSRRYFKTVWLTRKVEPNEFRLAGEVFQVAKDGALS